MAEPPAGEIHHHVAVTGSPVSHSLLPMLYRAAYAGLGLDDWPYKRRKTDSEALSALLTELIVPVRAGPAWAGLSAIMPHKQTLLARLDVIDPLAEVVDAVDTVAAQRSGAGSAFLVGFNTDAADIVGVLRETARIQTPDRSDGCLQIEQVVVLGSGATACSTLAALGKLRVDRITVTARRHAGPGRALSAAYRMGLDIEALTWKPSGSASNTEAARRLVAADVAISTLPAHAVDLLAYPLKQALDQVEGTRPGVIMLDVVYAPWPTAVAGAWAHAGGALAPGWFMFLHQAVPQVQLMTGQQSDIDLMRTALLVAIIPTADTSTAAH